MDCLLFDDAHCLIDGSGLDNDEPGFLQRVDNGHSNKDLVVHHQHFSHDSLADFIINSHQAINVPCKVVFVTLVNYRVFEVVISVRPASSACYR